MFGLLSYPARTVSDMASQHEGLPEFQGDGGATPEPRILATWPAQNGKARRSIIELMRERQAGPNVDPQARALPT